jgi:hypothetical protein
LSHVVSGASETKINKSAGDNQLIREGSNVILASNVLGSNTLYRARFFLLDKITQLLPQLDGWLKYTSAPSPSTFLYAFFTGVRILVAHLHWAGWRGPRWLRLADDNMAFVHATPCWLGFVSMTESTWQ